MSSSSTTTTSPPLFTCQKLHSTNSPKFIPFFFTKTPNFSKPISNHPTSFRISTTHFRIKTSNPNTAYDQDLYNQYTPDNFDFDGFLALVEFICLMSSAVISVGVLVSSRTQKPVFEWLGTKACVWQFVLLVGGVVIGAAVRRRQWRRICAGFERSKRITGVNLVDRIEKLEAELRSSNTVVRVLSRQLEKLGIRFRVGRKAMKQPIAEAAALAQKNSEATRALAAQEEILEKELGEIQKVLLAMQEQQQKQLELILAIVETGKLTEGRRTTGQGHNNKEPSKSGVVGVVKEPASNRIQSLAHEKGASNDSIPI